MHSATALQLACLRLSQRLKPQPEGRISVFSCQQSAKFQFSDIFFRSNCLQVGRVPLFYRAKNQFFLGLLALFFCVIVLNNFKEEII